MLLFLNNGGTGFSPNIVVCGICILNFNFFFLITIDNDSHGQNCGKKIIQIHNSSGHSNCGLFVIYLFFYVIDQDQY